jgi:restriction system protein
LKIDARLLAFLARHPNEVRSLTPRKFEELTAFLLKSEGFEVELTSRGTDGGIDIFARRRDAALGEVLLIVDCKRYAERHHVGVGIVRSLFGICERLRATMAMIVATTRFTTPARAFQAGLANRLCLKDFADLINWDCQRSITKCPQTA